MGISSSVASSWPAEYEKPVVAAAKAVCTRPEFLEAVRHSWGGLKLSADMDKKFGQSSPRTLYPEQYAAAADLRRILDMIGNPKYRLWLRVQYAASGAAGSMTDGKAMDGLFDKIRADLAALERIATALERQDIDPDKKSSKMFLDNLAWTMIGLHENFSLGKPKQSKNGSAVRLMEMLAWSCDVDATPDSCIKALAKYITICFDE